jgi:hypothetical protein
LSHTCFILFCHTDKRIEAQRKVREREKRKGKKRRHAPALLIQGAVGEPRNPSLGIELVTS